MKKVIILLFLCKIGLTAMAQHNYDDQSVIYSDDDKVGIGTSDPNATLSIVSSSGGGQLLIDGGLEESNQIINSSPAIYFSKAGGESYPFVGNQHLIVQARTSANGDIVFRVAENTSSILNAMMIKGGTGNVGIGIKDPSATLSIQNVINIADDDVVFQTATPLGKKTFSVNNTGQVNVGSALGGGFLMLNGLVEEDGDYLNSDSPAIFVSKASGTYPFNRNGNLIIQPRTSSDLGITFRVRESDESNLDALTIRGGTGFVGVGTDVPTSPLSVGSQLGNGLLQLSGSVDESNDFLNSNFPAMFVSVASDDANFPFNRNGNLIIQPRTSSNLGIIFRVRESATSNLNALTIAGESGNVGIGIDNADEKLVVDGKIRSEEIKVEIIAGSGPDYVFERGYELLSLNQVKQYVINNKHLPEIPSAVEMERDGIDLGAMNMKLLEKIEELTLYQIELLEKLEKQNERINKLENMISK